MKGGEVISQWLDTNTDVTVNKSKKGAICMRKTNAKTNVTVNKANGKAKVTTMRKANEFEMLMEAINGIATEIADIRKDVDTLKAEGKSSTKSAPKAKTTSKATAKKSSAKTTATKKTSSKGKKSSKKSAPATRAEAIEMWCEEKGYTEEDRAAYGEAIREITAEMRAENEEMITVDRKGNKTYDENYYVGRKWKREFNRRLVERGFGKRYKNV